VGTNIPNLPVSNEILYKLVPVVTAGFDKAEKREHIMAMITNTYVREVGEYYA